MEKYKKMLEELKRESLSKLKNLRQTEMNILPDEIDQVQEQEQEEMRQKMLSRESMFLKQIEQALGLVEANAYGECEECGCEIAVNRLKARPTATRCIECQSDYEKN